MKTEDKGFLCSGGSGTGSPIGEFKVIGEKYILLQPQSTRFGGLGGLGLHKNTNLCSVYSDNGKWFQVGILHEETKLLANQEVFPPACDCCKRAKVFLTSVPYLVQDEFFKQKFKRQNESDFCQRLMVKCTKSDSYKTF